MQSFVHSATTNPRSSVKLYFLSISELFFVTVAVLVMCAIILPSETHRKKIWTIKIIVLEMSKQLTGNYCRSLSFLLSWRLLLIITVICFPRSLKLKEGRKIHECVHEEMELMKDRLANHWRVDSKSNQQFPFIITTMLEWTNKSKWLNRKVNWRNFYFNCALGNLLTDSRKVANSNV